MSEAAAVDGASYVSSTAGTSTMATDMVAEGRNAGQVGNSAIAAVVTICCRFRC